MMPQTLNPSSPKSTRDNLRILIRLPLLSKTVLPLPLTKPQLVSSASTRESVQMVTMMTGRRRKSVGGRNPRKIDVGEQVLRSLKAVQRLTVRGRERSGMENAATHEMEPWTSI